MPSGKRIKSAAEDKLEDVTLSSIDEKLNLIISQLSAISSRVDRLESVTKEYEKSIDFISKDLEDTKVKISKLARDVEIANQSLTGFNNYAEKIAANEHQNRAKCLELNGIPYQKGENLFEGLDKLGKHLKLDWFKPCVDVDNVFRIRQSKRVIVKFTQTNKRDKFFQHYRKNILGIDTLGFQEEGNIYVNEVLSSEQAKLFWKARSYKKDHNFKYVWTSNQKIFLRKCSDSEAIPINCESDLNSIPLAS